MPALTPSRTCPLCDGAKVLYQSPLGQHRPADFRPFELITLLANKQVTTVQCPECGGTGTVSASG
jgi:ssDNA-binding Zn-finger/Zn-ribbon topoisomerase 1